MDNEREEQSHRIHNRKKSNSAKQAWKKHHYNYMKGNRKKSRESMKSFHSLAKELDENTKMIESKMDRDNLFDLKADILLENLAGGVSFSIDKKTKVISFSTYMSQEGGKGAYKVVNGEEAQTDFNVLYNDIKDELLTLTQTIDDSLKQILEKHGLKPTE